MFFKMMYKIIDSPKEYENLKGKKIPLSLENPIDAVFINWGEIANPYLFDAGFTPNLITLCSLNFGILCGLCLVNACYRWASFWYLMNYILDCWDGNFARKYNMCSKFGDWFDHLKDYFVGGMLYYIIWFRLQLDFRVKFGFSALSLLLFMMSAIYFGYQEKFYKKYNDKAKPSDWLKFFTPYCKLHPIDGLKQFRWTGTGTYTMFVVVFLFSLELFVKS